MNKLLGSVKREGMTLIPLGIYFNKRGIAKLELGLAKGKHKADKRETIKKRDWEREKGRTMRAKKLGRDFLHPGYDKIELWTTIKNDVGRCAALPACDAMKAEEYDYWQSRQMSD